MGEITGGNREEKGKMKPGFAILRPHTDNKTPVGNEASHYMNKVKLVHQNILLKIESSHRSTAGMLNCRQRNHALSRLTLVLFIEYDKQ